MVHQSSIGAGFWATSRQGRLSQIRGVCSQGQSARQNRRFDIGTPFFALRRRKTQRRHCRTRMQEMAERRKAKAVTIITKYWKGYQAAPPQKKKNKKIAKKSKKHKKHQAAWSEAPAINSTLKAPGPQTSETSRAYRQLSAEANKSQRTSPGSTDSHGNPWKLLTLKSFYKILSPLVNFRLHGLLLGSAQEIRRGHPKDHMVLESSVSWARQVVAGKSACITCVYVVSVALAFAFGMRFILNMFSENWCGMVWHSA